MARIDKVGDLTNDIVGVPDILGRDRVRCDDTSDTYSAYPSSLISR